MSKVYNDEYAYEYENEYGFEDENDEYGYDYESSQDDKVVYDDEIDEQNINEISGAEDEYFESEAACYNEDEQSFGQIASAAKKFEKESVQQSFVKIMEKYHSNDPVKRDEALSEAIALLDGFVHLIIKRSYYSYAKKYFADLIQEGYLGIVVGMEKYDPNISMPTTYFFPYIKHEMQGFITRNVDKTTSHYSSNIRKINKAIEVFERNNQQYTNIDIAIQAGMTIETVNQSMAIRNYRDEVHIDGCPGSVIDDKTTQKVQTPEEAYLEREQNDIIQRSIAGVLTDDEIFVLERRFGINNQKVISEAEIAKIMHIPKDKVKKLLNGSIRKLKNSELSYLFKDQLKEQQSLIEESCISFVPKEIAELEIAQMEAVEIDF